MSLSSVRVCGTGTCSVVVDRLNMDKRTPVWSTENPIHGRKVYKISTSWQSHNNELSHAVYLSKRDPQQRFFVYPTSSYAVTGDPKLLKYVDGHNTIKRRTFDVGARQMFIEVMPYAGISVQKFDSRLTAKQAKQAVDNLLRGLKVLHSKGFAHGDAHVHNAVILIQPNGDALARWIDFGEMHPTDNFQQDMKKFVGVIHAITNMVSEYSDYITNLLQSINGAAPVSAMDLEGRIFAGRTKRTIRSSSSSSHRATKKRLEF